MNDFITDCLEIVPGQFSDYKTLSEYHYQRETPSLPEQIYKIRGNEKTHDSLPDPIAVIVFSMPTVNLHGRTQATKGYFRKPRTDIGKLRVVNKKIRYLSRIIVDPRFHKQGLGSWLIKDTLERQTIPIVETLTPIDYTNKMFQKLGFKLFNSPSPKWYQRFTNALTNVRVDLKSINCPPAVHFRLHHLSPEQTNYIENEILQFLYHFRHRKGMTDSPERTAYFCSKLPYPQAYLIWHNPRVPRYDDNGEKNAVTPTNL